MKIQTGWDGHNAYIVDPDTGETITVGDCIINCEDGISSIVEANEWIFACDEFFDYINQIESRDGVTYARDGMNFAVQTNSASVGYEMVHQLFDKAVWVCHLKFYYEHAG